MKRIVVTGSECTGKTTLARQLGHWLSAPTLPEAARQVAEALGRPLTATDVDPIARRHLMQEDQLAASEHPPIVVLDTDLVSTVVYARHYYGSCDPWIEQAALARRGDLYLLACPDLPWVADGVRDRPTERLAIHALFQTQLQTMRALVLEVDGTGRARFGHAIAAVRGWRAATATPDRGETPPPGLPRTRHA